MAFHELPCNVIRYPSNLHVIKILKSKPSIFIFFHVSIFCEAVIQSYVCMATKEWTCQWRPWWISPSPSFHYWREPMKLTGDCREYLPALVSPVNQSSSFSRLVSSGRDLPLFDSSSHTRGNKSTHSSSMGLMCDNEPPRMHKQGY